MIKPGYKTSEFWFTFVSFIFSGLYLTGLINDFSQKEDLIRDVSHGVESCILIGGQLLVLYKYVKGRNEVKKIIQEREESDKPKRISSRTSRKNSSRAKTISTKSKKRSTK